jgi:hypothetical protein
LSPEKLRATKLAPKLQRDRHQVDGVVGLVTPRFDFEPRSAVAENWPLVRP